MTDSPDVHRSMEVTATNHKPWLYIATLLSMMYALSVLGIRLFVKYGVYALDDVILGLGYGFGIIQWSLTLSALQHGLGMAPGLVSGSQEAYAGRLIFSGRVTLHLLLGMVKISCLVLLQNVFTREHRKAWNICNLLIWICAICAVVACLVATVDCHPSTTLIAAHGVTCHAMKARATTLCVLEAATQLFCGLMPAYLFFDIQMATKRRLVVCSAFVFPIFNGVLFIWHVYAYSRWINSGPEHSNIGLVDPLIIQQVLVCYALVSATVPCLKGFAARFGTGGIHDAIGRDSTPRHSYPSIEAFASRGSRSGRRSSIALEMAEQHHAHQQGWEHKSSHNKLGDFADIPDSAYLLPSMKDDKLRPSPASSISSCAEIADRATLPPFQSQSATNTTSRLPNSRGQKQSKGKATGCFDWTSLNDYHSSAQGSNLNPLESPQPGPTDRKPSFVPFSINTTPPLNRLCPSNDSPKPPFSFLSRPSSPSRRPSDALSSRRASSYAPSRNASETPDPLRRPSGKHADLLEAQRHLSLRPDVDPVFGLGSVATAEATPVDARRESFPWAFDEEILTPAEAAGDVDEKEGGRKDSRNELASFPARSRQGSKGGGDGERRGSGRCPVGVRRAQELLGDSVPPLPVVGSDRKMVRGARSVDDMRRMSVPEKHEIEAGEEDDDLGNLDEVERGRQHSASVDVPRTKTKVKRNRANSILVTREVKLETSASAPVSVIGSRAGSFDWRGGGAER